MHFGRKVVRNTVHNAFLNTLTVDINAVLTRSAAFRQLEWRSYAFPLEMNLDDVLFGLIFRCGNLSQ